METVQIALNDEPYAAALADLLDRTLAREVRCVRVPDPNPNQDGVIVVDSDALNGLPLPLRHPERVVLITRNDPQHLAQAWNAGIRSVVYNEDPLATAALAIMAAELRVPKAEPVRTAPAGVAPCPGACVPGGALQSGAPGATPRKEGLR
jgi:hypothetical protein